MDDQGRIAQYPAEILSGQIIQGSSRRIASAAALAEGEPQRISAAHLSKAMDQSVRLHRSMLRCAHDFLIQTAQTAVADGRSKLEERLARWLLMANDRIDGPEVPLTHRFLAVMLGVHRPFVTRTVQVLEQKGLIRAGRQVITIVDRDGLVKMSNGAYLPPD